MKFLLDTNIVIPLEPTRESEYEINTRMAFEFWNSANKLKQEIYVHPYIRHDFERDKDEQRKDLRDITLDRYTQIPEVPPMQKAIESFGREIRFSNGWVDNHLLNCIYLGVCDYLVTEDTGIHRKARKLGLESQVLRLNSALQTLKDLFERNPAPPPPVVETRCYNLDVTNGIFSSLRRDYEGFDKWFEEKCRREHRTCFVVKGEDGVSIAGICIYNQEKSVEGLLDGRVLKLCTFKVADEFSGHRYGELLLKAAFEYAYANRIEYIYFTVHPEHEHLIDFASEFGFVHIGEKSRELVLCKEMTPDKRRAGRIGPLKAHILYGPRYTVLDESRVFVIPIQPQYHRILYPEMQAQTSFLQRQTCGNCIRKAYLCHSNRQDLREGDTILLYRSQDWKAITNVGIIEGTRRSIRPNEIARFVTKRTVYSYADIEELCDHNEVLAIRYRDVMKFDDPIKNQALLDNGVITGAIQTIRGLTNAEGIRWILNQIEM